MNVSDVLVEAYTSAGFKPVEEASAEVKPKKKAKAKK